MRGDNLLMRRAIGVFVALVVALVAFLPKAEASATLLLEEPYGKLGFFSALLQSIYSVESWLAQNSRSSSSLLNCGIGLCLLLIYLSFLLALVSSRNDAYFVVS